MSDLFAYINECRVLKQCRCLINCTLNTYAHDLQLQNVYIQYSLTYLDCKTMLSDRDCIVYCQFYDILVFIHNHHIVYIHRNILTVLLT